MVPTDTITQKYHVLVRIAQDQHVAEWFGSLTLTSDGDGETSVALNINDDLTSWEIQGEMGDCPAIGISIGDRILIT